MCNHYVSSLGLDNTAQVFKHSFFPDFSVRKKSLIYGYIMEKHRDGEESPRGQ